MKKRIIAFVLILTLIISNALPLKALAEEVMNAEENTKEIVMTEKQISELKPGESTVSVLGSIVTYLEEETDLSKAEQVLQVDKYSEEEGNNVQAEFSQESVRFGRVLNEQMMNYLNDSSGTQAQIVDVTDEDENKKGIYSKVTFSLRNHNFYLGDYLMVWVMDAISMYPSLSTLHTHISYNIDTANNKLNSLTIVCSVKESEIKARTVEYEKQLNKLIKIPLLDNTMSDAEKILYVHDRLVNIGHYESDDSIMCHTPSSVLLDSVGVCQSYANIMNQALNKLGIDSLFVCSENHAWNAVRLNDKWYYVDATWGDPVLNGTKRRRSYVSHEYILVQQDDFSKDHELDEDYKEVYGTITSKFGHAYDSFLPMDNITRGMWYSDGLWYFGHGNDLYCWNTANNDLKMLSLMLKNGNVNVGEVGGEIYYANMNGLFQYKNGVSDKLVNKEISDMYVVRNVLYYEDDSGTYEYIVEAPEITPTPTAKPTVKPTQEPTTQPTPGPITNPDTEPTVPPTPGIVMPTPTANPTAQPQNNPSIENPIGTSKTNDAPKTTVVPLITDVTDNNVVLSKVKIKKVSNKKGRKAVVSLKKVKGAVAYQVIYHTKKSFSKAKSVYSKKKTVKLKNLKKNKTYYIKVRAIYKINSEYMHGKWSGIKKIKIKR